MGKNNATPDTNIISQYILLTSLAATMTAVIHVSASYILNCNNDTPAHLAKFAYYLFWAVANIPIVAQVFVIFAELRHRQTKGLISAVRLYTHLALLAVVSFACAGLTASFLTLEVNNGCKKPEDVMNLVAMKAASQAIANFEREHDDASKSIELDGKHTLQLDLSDDSHYVLFINGDRVSLDRVKITDVTENSSRPKEQ